MIVLVTAGGTTRYYCDILRVIAQPLGSYLQFRYEAALITDDLWGRFSTEELGGSTCLISYLDAGTERKEDNLVPLRFATVVRASRHGSTGSILLELGRFPEPANLSALREELLDPANGNGATESSPTKFVWQPLKPLTTVKQSPQLEAWEAVVTQIASREMFSNEERFFMVHGVATGKTLATLEGSIETRQPIAPVKGQHFLRPAREYALELYQYYPSRKAVSYRVEVASSHEALTVAAGAPVVVDSPYDQPTVRLRTGEPDRRQEAVLTIRTASSRTQTDFGFELPFVVQARWIRTTGYVMLVGGLLAGPQISAMSVVTLPRLIIVVVSSMAAAAVVAFGLRKIK
jgi:hypothetical protein